MFKKYKVLVLTDHMPWGHRSIAKAIYGYLKKREKEEDIRVDYAEIMAETGVLGDAYNLAYKYFPRGNRVFMKVTLSKMIRKLVTEASLDSLPRLKRIVDRTKPDLVISTFYLHSHALALWKEREQKGFKLWTVVADPWTINAISFVKGADLHLVYDEVGEKFARKYGVPDDEILKCGWWTREEMYKKYDIRKIRNRLGFGDNRPVIFVGGGSLGTNSLTRIMPILPFLKRKVGLIFNTGKDKLGYNLVEEYSRLLRKIRKDEVVQIKNMGWIENMAEVLSACDIVFGKAGPNFLFDVVAVEKPFVAITHIGGQEDGNIDLIKKKRLGWIREKKKNAARFLVEYLENPEKYNNAFKKQIKLEAMKNKDSLSVILERIRKENKKPTKRVTSIVAFPR
ncbi:MAG: MGDG synthase family glycosyltransferase [Patescibacteria group bacterium]|jgi:processive 1,2-diacylglycerol beta-glucosyltransferase